MKTVIHGIMVPHKIGPFAKLLHRLYCKVSVMANWCWCLLHQPTEGFVFQARWKGCNGRKRQVLGNRTMKILGNEGLFSVRSRCTCRTVRCDWAPLARLTRKDPVRQLLAGHSQSPALQMVSRWYLVHTFITPRCPDLRVRFCISSLSLHVQSMKPLGSFQPLMHEFCCAALLLPGITPLLQTKHTFISFQTQTSINSSHTRSKTNAASMHHNCKCQAKWM